MKPHALTRRTLLSRSLATMGVAGLGLRGGLADASGVPNPLNPQPSHILPKAKRMILFFQTGGVSHVDSFDPKAKLYQMNGKTHGHKKLFAGPWKSKPRGESGIETTELFPHISKHIDKMCLMRSLHGDHGDHFAATMHMFTGSNGSALPGIGSWISYGLGTHNLKLPAHMVFAKRRPYAGSQAWDSVFLPACHQGTRITPGNEPVRNLKPQPGASKTQRLELALLEKANAAHAAARSGNSDLPARQLSFQTAYDMQQLAPKLFDLSKEDARTLSMYGTQRGDQTSFAWQCLMARRMAEEGVRVIELIDTGASGNWDTHSNIKSQDKLAKAIDQPIAALMADLEQRGMLDETLIVWCTEFGRTPTRDGSYGRGHHRHVFTCWLAGGGVKGGTTHGSSDDIGAKVATDGVHVHDFHATILHLMGLDHEQLVYHHAGQEFSLTGVHGRVIDDIIA